MIVSASPHMRSGATTQKLMLDVIIALVPALAMAVFLFGVRVLALTAVSVGTCVLAEYGYRRLRGQSNTIGDLSACVTGLLLAQGIGRWGNYANQEAFGTNTTMPWGMTSDKVASYISSHQSEFAEKGITMDASVPVHPTFLYESLWCIASFIIIYIICKKAYKFSGQLILCYGILYGAERAVVEGLRTDSLYIGTTSLRVSQVLSMVLVFICAAILIAKLVELKKHPVPFSPVETLPAELDYSLEDEKAEKREKSRQVKKAKEAKNKMLEKKQKEEGKNGSDS